MDLYTPGMRGHPASDDEVWFRRFPDWNLSCAETGDAVIYATSDVFFKYLFGNIGSEPVLLSFINAVLGDGADAPVLEVEIRTRLM